MFKNVEWLEFVSEVEKSDSIVCIGAGARMGLFKEFFQGDVLNKVKYIADNSAEKQGIKIEISGKEITVCPVQVLISEVSSKTIIIITPVYFRELLRQLESYKEFTETSIFSFANILDSYAAYKAKEKYMPNNIKLNKTMLIPKKIHYCWFGRNPLPERYKKWMDSWKKFCPDYEIIEWNEDNYDVTKNKYMKQAYEAGKWGFVPDYARLDIIYNYGGIYLDTDVELVKNLDELLYQEGFAGFESDKYVALGLGFGAVAGNELIKDMRNEYDKYSFIDESGSFNLMTSPILQTQYLIERGLKQNGEYQILDGGFVIYPEKVLNGSGYPPRNVRLTPDTYSVHHYDGSWLDADARQREEKRRKEKGIKV